MVGNAALGRVSRGDGRRQTCANRRFVRLVFALLIGVVGGSAGAGEFPVVEGPPPGFEVVRLTNVGSGVGSSIPDINDCGEVTWAHFTPPFESSVYVYRDGVVTRVTDGTLYEDGSTLDNEGRMAWRRGPTRPTANDLYIADWDAVVFTGPTPLSWPRDNDVGQLVWDTTLKDNSNVCEIFEFTRATGAWRQVSFEGLSSQGAQINNAGVIVWAAFDFNVSPWQSRILMDDHGVTTSLTPGIGQRQSPDINDDGVVVWMDSEGVHIMESGETRLLFSEGRLPRINNQGHVYFSFEDAVTISPDAHVFMNGVFYKLPDEGLRSSRCTINNLGEIAWLIFANDGSFSDVILLRRAGSLFDFDGDCRIDLRDLRAMQICVNRDPAGMLLADCARGDGDDDGDVDLFDVEIFRAAMNGPSVAISDCEGENSYAKIER